MATRSSLAEGLHRHRVATGALGLVLLLAGAWTLTNAYHEAIPEPQVSSRTLWSEHAAFTYAIAVTRNSTHFPMGTVLPMGEPAYFRTVSEAIEVEHVWRAEAPGSDGNGLRGVAASRLAIDVRAQSPDGRPYWSLQHTLAEATTQDPVAGLTLRGRIDLDALLAEVESINKELPAGEAVLNWTVRATVTYALDTAGGSVQGASEHLLPFSVNDPRFTLPPADELRWEDEHKEEVVRVHTSAAGMPGVLRSLGGLAMAGTGPVALAVALWASGQRVRAGFDAEVARYRDWISKVDGVPDAATRGPLVDVSTLEDLVHLAADARTRVILDARAQTLYALLPGITYRYSSHSATRPVPVPERDMAVRGP